MLFAMVLHTFVPLFKYNIFMKQSLTLFLSFLFIVLLNINANAGPTPTLPSIDLGIKAGANFANLSGSEWEKSMQPGFTGGAFVGLRVKKLGVQVEALINSAKYNGADLLSGTDFKTTNLDIPILLQYKIIPMLWLQIGPQYSTVLSASTTGGSFSGDAKSVFNSSFNGVLGLELKLPVKFNVGVRYILGFSNVNNESYTSFSSAWQQRSIQLYLGFRFL
jgi:hypothetical protein